jgi:hypothetical protein
VPINHAADWVDRMSGRTQQNPQKLSNLHAAKPENATKAEQNEFGLIA